MASEGHGITQLSGGLPTDQGGPPLCCFRGIMSSGVEATRVWLRL